MLLCASFLGNVFLTESEGRYVHEKFEPRSLLGATYFLSGDIEADIVGRTKPFNFRQHCRKLRTSDRLYQTLNLRCLPFAEDSKD